MSKVMIFTFLLVVITLVVTQIMGKKNLNKKVKTAVKSIRDMQQRHNEELEVPESSKETELTHLLNSIKAEHRLRFEFYTDENGAEALRWSVFKLNQLPEQIKWNNIPNES